jgi:2-polyprenyl-3-methyl-5-hydroxy-6-metoxy-1,4-benzoquinol methylase
MSSLKKCPFCGKDAKSKYKAPGFFYQCSSCGLTFKQVDAGQDLNELYTAAWSDIDNHKEETGGTDLKLARVYAKKLAESLGLDNFSGLRILDFGAGDGSMLAALSELGADVYGFEPFGYEQIKSKGFKVFRNLDEIPQGMLFDGVISIDVLEHVPSPWGTLKELYGFLVHKGWLCVTTPNAHGLNARFSGSGWRELHNPSHLYFLTPRDMKAFFIRLGFTKVRRLKWFVQYANDPFKKIVHYLLQLSGLDGEMRYLILKP